MSNIPELPTLNSKPLNASHQYIEVKINLIKQKAWTIKISIKIHIISIPYETFLEQLNTAMDRYIPEVEIKW